MNNKKVSLVVSPLPGKDFTCFEDALMAWRSGKVFVVRSVECKGKPFNINDVPGEVVKIIFDNDRQECIYNPE